MENEKFDGRPYNDTHSNMHHNCMLPLTMFIVLMLLANFQVSYNHEIGRRPVRSCQGPCSNPNPFPQPNPEYVVIPQNPVSGSIFANVPSVSLFTNTILDAILSTDILCEVFDLSQTPANLYADFVREYTLKSTAERNIPNGEELAEWTARAILQYFDVLPLSIVARVYANMCANYLFVSGYLDISNAQQLALAYAQSFVDSADTYLTSDPTSKFLVLVRGYENFLLWLLEDPNKEGPLVTFYLGNEWFMAAVNYRYS